MRGRDELVADFKNYINGRWVESITGDEFLRENPATGEPIGTFTKSGAEDVEAAVASASEAFKTWRLYPAATALYQYTRALEMVHSYSKLR